MENKNTQVKYWYEFYYYFCPLCNKTEIYKERKYTNKPKNHGNRHHWEEMYDWCEL